MMMVRFRESGGRHKYNHGKQQGLFHSPMIGELKLRKSALGKAITLLNCDALLPLSHIGVASTLAGMVDCWNPTT